MKFIHGYMVCEFGTLKFRREFCGAVRDIHDKGNYYLIQGFKINKADIKVLMDAPEHSTEIQLIDLTKKRNTCKKRERKPEHTLSLRFKSVYAKLEKDKFNKLNQLSEYHKVPDKSVTIKFDENRNYIMAAFNVARRYNDESEMYRSIRQLDSAYSEYMQYLFML